MGYGRIPDEVIEAVLQRHDIADVIGKYVHLTKQGHYLKGLCPFHSEKSPSFTVTPEKQIYHCFGCGAGGNMFQFLREIEGYTFAEAVRHLAEEADIPVTWEESLSADNPQQKDRSKMLEANEKAAKLYRYILMNTDQGKNALDYVRNRQMSDKLIDAFQIGYAPAMWDTLVQQLQKAGYDLPLMERGGLVSARSEGDGYIDKFRDRVIFPIWDAQGKVIAFGGRALGDVQPKYLNSPETMLFNKSRVLYNFHQARPQIRKTNTMVLFEGYMDVVKAWEAGVRNGVGTMGTALTPEHAELIRRNAGRVVICYDGDSAGQNAAYKAIPLLEQAGCEVKVAMLPDAQDPDEYITAYGSERFVREIIDYAVPSIKYRLHYIRRHFRLQEEGDRIRYQQTALKMIADLSSIEREHYLKQLAGEFETSYESLKQDLANLRMKSEKNRTVRDNIDVPWNNGRHNRKETPKAPLYPAYHNAERQLLAVMMHDRDVSAYVEERLGDEFNVDAHAVLAAYLYAFYAQNSTPSVSRYMAMIQDDKLENLASSIAMMGAHHGVNEVVIDDYIKEIKKYPKQQEISRKKEEMIRAERSGDPLRAAQILSEIIALEKQLKFS
ncbi:MULTISPECIES: DNA primase [unclassified Paenibacillus]|uniref:DNA primase n=1 Tax=unclassified Paenibacillus TaxID=185978 RepID=UPI00020D7380|nr:MULTISPECIES: DNA primase [unclassified Paenibacillus]EGL19931.1 DNA primase [Paenibacillus sp. HGF7]EPD92334.1 DNA primase [Paenibacillus sp. HGH0039]